jgi:hypothetical protein
MATTSKAQRILTIVCTGGPCGGKSTALNGLRATISAMRLDAYTIPEVPTLVQAAGFPYPGMDGGELLKEFEYTLFDLQKTFEDRAKTLAEHRAAHGKRPAVFILDRCLIDMKAYMPLEMWEWMLSRAGLTDAEVFARYDYAMHFVTAAEGAEAFYITSNNVARTESVDAAVAKDYDLRRVYQPMLPRWSLITNEEGGFAQKLARSVSIVKDLVCKELSCGSGHTAGETHDDSSGHQLK